MNIEQAEKVLRAAVASNHEVGEALVALLERMELDNYRQSKGVTDTLVLTRIAGWAEGIHAVKKRVTPDESAAPSRPAPFIGANRTEL